MKKIIVLTVLIISITQFAFAQNPIAKLKYEEAEQAYALNNFELTINKLKEVEALLKSTSPKTLYLQIVAQSKIIENDPLTDYALIENTKKLCTKYLKAYEKLPDNEDKYRDIYKIGEAFPATRKDFDNRKYKMESAAEEIRLAELNKQKKYDDAFLSYVYFDEYKIGLTLDETKKEYPAFFKKHQTTKGVDGDVVGTGDLSVLMSRSHLAAFYVKNGKVCGYSGRIERGDLYGDKDPEFTTGFKAVSALISMLNTQFNFSPVEKITDISFKKWPGKQISYTWEKNNKTIRLDYLNQSNKGSYHYSIYIYSFDKN